MVRASFVLKLGVGVALLASACAPAAPGLGADARINVSPTARVAHVGNILGAVVNENYWAPGNEIHPDWADKYLGRTIDSIRQLAPSNNNRFAIRFGHTPTDGRWGGDGYHWATALDTHQWSTSIDSIMEYANRAGSEPYVAVNFGSGTAQEAAEFVAYTNGTDDSDPSVQLRIQQGHPEPYNVQHWLIGFEQYGSWETGNGASRPFEFANPAAQNGGDPQWFGMPASDPGWFAARAASFARAMRAASPQPIRIIIPGNNWDLQYWGGAAPSFQTILGAAGQDIDGVAIHFYPMGTTYGDDDDSLLGRPQTFGEKLDSLSLLLAQDSPQGKPITVEDVEYNNRPVTNDQTHQLVNGLFVADTLRVLASKNVGSAFYFAVSSAEGNGSGFTYFENGAVDQPTPTYLATQIMAHHLGTDVVTSDVTGSRVMSAAGGSGGAIRFPSVTTLASVSADRKTLYLDVINKHPMMDQALTINLGDVRVASGAELATLSGPSPHSLAGEVRVSPLNCSVAKTFTCTFPAHSLTGITIPLDAPIGLP